MSEAKDLMIIALLIGAAVTCGAFFLGKIFGFLHQSKELSEGYKVSYKYANVIKPFTMADFPIDYDKLTLKSGFNKEVIAVEKKIDTQVAGRATIASVRQPAEGRKFKEGLGESTNEAA